MNPLTIIALVNGLVDIALRLSQELPKDDELRKQIEATAARVRDYKPLPLDPQSP